MKERTRRQFLRESMFSTAAVMAAPMIGAARAQNTGANDKLLCAVVGCKGRGGSHISAFSDRKDCEIAYIVDIDEKVAQNCCNALEKKTGKRPKWVKDMREAFDDKSLDIVSTATPNHWHALCGVWAMQAGKDVYIEKPISYDVAEGAALVAAAKKYKRMCQVGTQCRSNPAIQNAMKFLADGGIGEVSFARGLCYKRRGSIGALGDYEIPGEVDFNLWSGPAPYTSPKLTRPRFHYDWHWQRLYGNGDSGNQGPHQTDIARWGLGINRHPNSVIAYGGRLGYQAERNDPAYVDAGDTANTEIAIYDYGDKCMVFETRGLSVDNAADMEINTMFDSVKGNKIGVIFYGTDGYLLQRTYSHCVVFDLKGEVIKEFKGGGDHYDNFVRAVRSRRAQDLNSDAFQGHLSAALAHLANISYYLGEENRVSIGEAKAVLEKIKSRDNNILTLNRTLRHLTDNGVDLDKYPISMGPMLQFDPKKEVFTNNAAANAMLRREYRSPFVCPTPDNV
ncbi:Gfo/Idh/MocA family protein [Anaerobaca lacustris]|uniref:Gfo/Idh/MocA family oxidoreductase n=1 Tax=Anaerobaca lacustris TaxID=3044600 RepID=A0AAW6U264_9BACT|nr:Gfo/Idh/MocA family oxidoreductase [Sedimentisphaerales bacterium M17dextr]